MGISKCSRKKKQAFLKGEVKVKLQEQMKKRVKELGLISGAMSGGLGKREIIFCDRRGRLGFFNLGQ